MSGLTTLNVYLIRASSETRSHAFSKALDVFLTCLRFRSFIGSLLSDMPHFSLSWVTCLSHLTCTIYLFFFSLIRCFFRDRSLRGDVEPFFLTASQQLFIAPSALLLPHLTPHLLLSQVLPRFLAPTLLNRSFRPFLLLFAPLP